MDNNQHTIASYLRKDSSVSAAYVHGSRSKEHFREESDYDIALLLKRGSTLTALDLLNIGSELESLLPYRFDVSVVGNRNIVFAKEVIAKGICILCKDRFQKETFEMLTLSMYAKLQYDRREVLNEYQVG